MRYVVSRKFHDAEPVRVLLDFFLEASDPEGLQGARASGLRACHSRNWDRQRGNNGRASDHGRSGTPRPFASLIVTGHVLEPFG